MASNEAKIQLTLEALGKDEKLRVAGAATLYGVSKSTLKRRRAGTTSRRDTPANSRKLTILEENAIIQYILELDS